MSNASPTFVDKHTVREGDEIAKRGESPGEVRKIDPKTGGQKGVKLQRYDLIPTKQWAIIRDALPENAARPIRTALSLFDQWWFGRAPDSILIDAAAIAMAHLGQMIAGSFASDSNRGALLNLDLAEECLASVYGFGATKYDDDNWKRGYAWGYSWAAGRRHLIDHIGGVTHDTGDNGSNLPHLAHFVWHCITLHWFARNMPMSDPRGKL